MSRARAVLAVGASVLAVAAADAGASAGRTAAATASRSTAVGVGMREWALTVYRPAVKPGTVRFLMTNRGEDPHNLRVTGPHGYRSAVSADAAPAGGRQTLVVHLRRRGTYRLLCVKPGHAALGMRATIRVRGG